VTRIFYTDDRHTADGARTQVYHACTENKCHAILHATPYISLMLCQRWTREGHLRYTYL